MHRDGEMRRVENERWIEAPLRARSNFRQVASQPCLPRFFLSFRKARPSTRSSRRVCPSIWPSSSFNLHYFKYMCLAVVVALVRTILTGVCFLNGHLVEYRSVSASAFTLTLFRQRCILSSWVISFITNHSMVIMTPEAGLQNPRELLLLNPFKHYIYRSLTLRAIINPRSTNLENNQ